jgi:hypothetical protein
MVLQILSYPRSGNHLARFIIEILTGHPTKGCSDTDIPLHKEKYKYPVNFNMKSNEFYGIKQHNYDCIGKDDKILFIIRNPREVLLRHPCTYQHDDKYWDRMYFTVLDKFNSHQGKKLIIFYEDLITKKRDTCAKIYDFLDDTHKDEERLSYLMKNIGYLYDACYNIQNKKWECGRSKLEKDHFYNNIPNETFKTKFNNYLKEKIKKYPFLIEKYNLKY